ncbi:MAG: chromate resistance protein ChrB domain-containing protein [Sulfuricaulis sp.]
MTKWLLLIISLPTQSATPRMRVWRALKVCGAEVLRDGVYLLPQSATSEQAFREQVQEVEAAGGIAYLIPFTSNAEETSMYCELFDRSENYAQFLEKTDELRNAMARLAETEARRQLAQLHRDFEVLVATDHFPGSAKEQAQQALEEAEATLSAALSPGEPQAVMKEIARLNRDDYQERVWATRARPWVDRLASAWLIRRFIDHKARIVWLKDPPQSPSGALGFDFDGATFTHVGARVTFEVLAASFGLTDDKALVRLGLLVHFLDVGGVSVAEARGLEMILTGMRQFSTDDEAMLAEAEKTFDALYAAYQNGS